MAPKTLDTLFHDTLRDVYYAERKALQGLRKMARGVHAAELRDAFETHRDETEGQIQRLQQVFEMIGRRAQGKTCAAMDGITEEAEEILEEYADSPALDAGLLAAAQAVEHYEITRYGTLAAWALTRLSAIAVSLASVAFSSSRFCWRTLAQSLRPSCLAQAIRVP